MTVLDELFAEHFAHDGVEINGFVHRFDSAGGFESNEVSGQFMVFFDGLTHDVSRFQGGSRLYLARAGLDEVCSCIHGKNGRLLDVYCGLKSACFKNHFQGSSAGGCFDFCNFVGAGFIVSA